MESDGYNDKELDQDQYSRLPKMLRNTSFDTFDLCRSEASEGTSVLGTAKAGTNGSLKLRHWSSNRRLSFTTRLFRGHCS